MDIEKIVSQASSWSKTTVATRSAIEKCANDLGLSFPPDYVRFLLVSNGAEGYTPPQHIAGYFALYTVEELVACNEGYEIQKRFPGYLSIGTNGAGELFLLNTLAKDQPTLMVRASDNTLKNAIVVGTNFAAFLQSISKSSGTESR